MILATIQSPATLALMQQLQQQAEGDRGEVLLSPAPYKHPRVPRRPYQHAVDDGGRQGCPRALCGQERFGPVSFVIACDDATDALAQAPRDVKEFGGPDGLPLLGRRGLHRPRRGRPIRAPARS
jgi:hypothetical protein